MSDFVPPSPLQRIHITKEQVQRICHQLGFTALPQPEKKPQKHGQRMRRKPVLSTAKVP